MKIETHELMIGNLILIDQSIYKVVSINEYGYGVELFEKTHGMCTNGGRRISIPITEEWLIKFGCVKLEQDLFSIEANGIEIQLTFKGDGYNVDIGGIVIAFVKKIHRWQNLYEAIKINN